MRPASAGFGRRAACAIALLLAGVILAALIVETARGTDGQELAAAKAIRHEFGTGSLAGCFLAIARRETGGTYDAHAMNLRDVHADGSRGSFGLLQIGALWRRHGESVDHFARRMFEPAANARRAHDLYRRYGLQPWGGRCG